MNLLVPDSDPIAIQKLLWPDVYFYSKQREIIYSVRDNIKTVVVAGNKLGKDYVAGFICVWYFLHPLETRIVTTSVKDSHLDVLWGEIGRWITTSKYPLRTEEGGPLYCTSRNINKVVGGRTCDISYLKGMVSAKPEGLAGHHATRTLFMVDEASASEVEVFDQGETWSKKQLYFGNPLSSHGRFYRDVKGGDLVAAM